MKIRIGDKAVIYSGPMEGAFGTISSIHDGLYGIDVGTINGIATVQLRLGQFQVMLDHLAMEGDEIVRYVRETAIDGERSVYHRDHNYVHEA